MTAVQPREHLDPRYSTPDATATPWEEARECLADAEVYWLTTVRPDGRPHVTPLHALWFDDALWFSTGVAERKAANLAANRFVVVTTGCNTSTGLDVVVEGTAERESDDAVLTALADAYAAKYGPEWRLEVRDGCFWSAAGGDALVFRVIPTTVFGFGKGEVFSQTRWRFR